MGGESGATAKVLACAPCGGGRLYTDGSGGGSRDVPKALHRVGAGSVSFDTWTDEAGRLQLAGDNFAFAMVRAPGTISPHVTTCTMMHWLIGGANSLSFFVLCITA